MGHIEFEEIESMLKALEEVLACMHERKNKLMDMIEVEGEDSRLRHHP